MDETSFALTLAFFGVEPTAVKLAVAFHVLVLRHGLIFFVWIVRVAVIGKNRKILFEEVVWNSLGCVKKDNAQKTCPSSTELIGRDKQLFDKYCGSYAVRK